MAAAGSIWVKPTAGPLQGEPVVLNKAEQNQIGFVASLKAKPISKGMSQAIAHAKQTSTEIKAMPGASKRRRPAKPKPTTGLFD